MIGNFLMLNNFRLPHHINNPMLAEAVSSHQFSFGEQTVRICRLNVVGILRKSVLKRCLKSQKTVPKNVQFDRSLALFFQEY
jgi:hypothetical protein